MAIFDTPVKPAPSSLDGDCEVSSAELSHLPDEVLSKIFASLPQKQRASTSLVCKRWAVIGCLSSHMWRTVHFDLWLHYPSTLERSESFVSWVMKRAPYVKSLTVCAKMDTQTGNAVCPSEHLIWGNLTSALTLLGQTLEEFTMEWYRDLYLSGWMAAFLNLHTASFTAPSITVRPGLGSLDKLRNLRFRSLVGPLSFGTDMPLPGNQSTSPGSTKLKLLPLQLKALRMDGCHLTTVPDAMSTLEQLTDLVLSNNYILNVESLNGLSKLTALKQLTVMGTRMEVLPPVLSTLRNLQVLYLDGVVGQVQEPTHIQCDNVLGPLNKLGILSLGSNTLKEFPSELLRMTTIRALYLDNNPLMMHLPDGPYLDRLKVLGLDWSLLFECHEVLAARAKNLEKLCLTRIGGIQPVSDLEVHATAVIKSLQKLPRLNLVLLPMLDHSNVELSRVAVDLALQLASVPRITVRAVSYSGISNEWIEWLEKVEQEAEVSNSLKGMNLM